MSRAKVGLADTYIDTIIFLRESGYKWPQVQEWFAKQGLVFSVGTLQQAHQRHFGSTYVKYERNKV
jgi:hypothetical protein